MSNCKELWMARLKHQHLQTAGKDHSIGKRDGVPEKESERARETDIYIYIEREMDINRNREKEGVRMQCFMKKEDNCLIDVENVETTGERCYHLN